MVISFILIEAIIGLIVFFYNNNCVLYILDSIRARFLWKIFWWFLKSVRSRIFSNDFCHKEAVKGLKRPAVLKCEFLKCENIFYIVFWFPNGIILFWSLAVFNVFPLSLFFPLKLVKALQTSISSNGVYFHTGRLIVSLCDTICFPKY